MTTPTIEINLGDILSQAKEFKESSAGPSFAKTAFLPNGNHQGRFVISPDGRLYENYDAYGYFGRGVRTPAHAENVPEGFEDKINSLYWNVLKPLNMWKYGTQRVNLMYFFLTATDSVEADRWEPNNLYALYLRPKHMNTILAWVNSMSKDDPSTITQGFNPSSKTNAISLSVVDGNISVSVRYPITSLDPIDMDKHTYVNLDNAYISPEFNVEKYNNLLSQYLEAAREADPVATGIWEEKGHVPDSYWTGEEEKEQSENQPQTQVEQQAQAQVQTQQAEQQPQPQPQAQAQTQVQPQVQVQNTEIPAQPQVQTQTQVQQTQQPQVQMDSSDPFARFQQRQS